MAQTVDNVKLITTSNINEYFAGAVKEAIAHQNLTPKEESVVYIINLLSYFALSENVFDNDTDGLSIKPLALIYKDAVESVSSEERNKHLRKLGDIALFTSGFFAPCLERSAVGIDYFISMGGTAYSSLAECYSRLPPDTGISDVFLNLSERFSDYVDILTEVSECNELLDDHDILSLYESWLNTGSNYAKKRLQEKGIYTLHHNHKKH